MCLYYRNRQFCSPDNALNTFIFDSFCTEVHCDTTKGWLGMGVLLVQPVYDGAQSLHSVHLFLVLGFKRCLRFTDARVFSFLCLLEVLHFLLFSQQLSHVLKIQIQIYNLFIVLNQVTQECFIVQVSKRSFLNSNLILTSQYNFLDQRKLISNKPLFISVIKTTVSQKLFISKSQTDANMINLAAVCLCVKTIFKASKCHRLNVFENPWYHCHL